MLSYIGRFPEEAPRGLCCLPCLISLIVGSSTILIPSLQVISVYKIFNQPFASSSISSLPCEVCIHCEVKSFDFTTGFRIKAPLVFASRFLSLFDSISSLSVVLMSHILPLFELFRRFSFYPSIHSIRHSSLFPSIC